MLTPGKPTGSFGLPSPKVHLKPLAHLVKQGGLPHRAGNPASFYSERADPPAAASGAHYGGLSPCVMDPDWRISMQMVYHNQKPQTNIRHKFHQQGPSPSLVRMEFVSPVCALQSKRFDTFDTTVHVHTMQVAGYTSDSSYSPTHPSTCRIQFFRSQTSQCMINRHQGVLAAIRHRFL